ncbi:hypothetical protein DFH09DRAFT_1304395 [Mycena vulgaris]|nr:hypothetical protein DFH09DRAFT_1304395 [Mycena vulgaris]
MAFLRSANRVLHDEDIERNPVVLDLGRRPSLTQKLVESSSIVPPPSFDSDMEVDEAVAPRPNVASRISHDLGISSVRKLTWSDVRSAHRCAGYVREEITLATTMGDSAVVSHDTPSPLEICAVCHEVVGVSEVFQCVCGDPNPGLGPTVKCQACKLWSHSDCVGNPKEFTCQFCRPVAAARPHDSSVSDAASEDTVHDDGSYVALPAPYNSPYAGAAAAHLAAYSSPYVAPLQAAPYSSPYQPHMQMQPPSRLQTHSSYFAGGVSAGYKSPYAAPPPSGYESPYLSPAAGYVSPAAGYTNLAGGYSSPYATPPGGYSSPPYATPPGGYSSPYVSPAAGYTNLAGGYFSPYVPPLQGAAMRAPAF